MALYFVTTGAGLRASDVLYDRGGSAFACAPSGDWDWDALFDGVDLFHVTGITPALGELPATGALAAMKAARANGVRISFDGNYRARLWDRRDVDPRTVLRDLVAQVDILFGNHRDVSLLLDRDFDGEGEARRHAAAKAAFDAFPALQMMASTARHVLDSDRHRLSARIDTRGAQVQTDAVFVNDIVDRIGTGDAFAAGVLDALSHDLPIDRAAANGLALSSLKHSLPGDVSLFDRETLENFAAHGFDVRR